MIHVNCIFAKFQTGAIADHCFKAIKPPLKDYQYFQNMLSMLLSKCIFKTPVIRFIGFKVYDTRYLHFC